MTADDVIQKAAGKIYQPPLSSVRYESDFPDLANPFHLLILLIDCDTEIMMNGILGFLENMTGRHLVPTIEALQLIGAFATANQLQQIQDCMTRHGVTWQQLRGDFEGSREFEITSFRKLHGPRLDSFASEARAIGRGFSLFYSSSAESAYELLCSYLQSRLIELQREIAKRAK